MTEQQRALQMGFNSRSRGGSDLVAPFYGRWWLGFQFTLPRGERPIKTKSSGYCDGFQFTLPRGERLENQRWPNQYYCFNSRSRGGSDSALRMASGTLVLFQFTLPRGERLVLNGTASGGILVSIHAPAGGATLQVEPPQHKWGCFNSRSRGGSDRTSTSPAPGSAPFQFTLPRGERPAFRRPLVVKRWFQFTLPRGERRSPPREPAPRRSFNSRSRGGSDSVWRLGNVVIGVSIHAPAGGATRMRVYMILLRRSFNSRSRGGSDLCAD